MTDEILDQYLRQGNMGIRENAEAWKTAIGLQAVDGLKPSQYLVDTAIRNIEGDITIDEVQQLLHEYYENKTSRTPEDDEQEECDKASANIKKILSSQTLAFNSEGYISIHRHIFKGVFKHAGKLRTYDFTKREFVLGGDTVNYLNWEDLRRAIDYDIQQEKDFSYRDLSDEERVRHLCRFTAGLWQIHPFCEGNTRTTAVFLIQYLRSIGYKNINNDMFADHSWYFRNALVRANYRNPSLGVDYDISFLEKFFRNLLLGEKHELRNRQMIVGLNSQNVAVNVAEELTERQQTIIQIVRQNVAQNVRVNTQFLADELRVNRKTIQRDMQVLKGKRIIEWQGSSKSGCWRLFSSQESVVK